MNFKKAEKTIVVVILRVENAVQFTEANQMLSEIDCLDRCYAWWWANFVQSLQCRWLTSRC